MAGRPRVRASHALGASALLALAMGTGGCVFGQPSETPGPSSSPPAASRSPAGSSAPSASAAGSVAASATPAAGGGPLAAGTYARVKVDGLRIRVSAKATATPVGALFVDDVVQIRSDAGVSGGYHWYEIETVQTFNDQHQIGFIAGAKGAESYLEPMSGPPSPTPPRSASPSAKPSGSPSG
jgi:hypothetical protein